MLCCAGHRWQAARGGAWRSEEGEGGTDGAAVQTKSQVTRAGRTDRAKQMGPALLPTPLSPARGRPGPSLRSAGRSSRALRAHLAPDASCWPLPRLRRAACVNQLRHRRSHRHPTCACIAVRTSRSTGLQDGIFALSARPRPLVRMVNDRIDHTGAGAPVRPRSLAEPAAFRHGTTSHIPHRSGLHWAKAFCMPLLRIRVDSHHNGLWLGNQRHFKALRLDFPLSSRPKTVGECAARRLSARLARPTYPLFPGSLVDSGGQLNASAHSRPRCTDWWANRCSHPQIALCESFVAGS